MDIPKHSSYIAPKRSNASMRVGLTVHHSNRLESLASRLAADAVPLSDPLAPEIIVVQHRTVGTWLDLQLARVEGIAANIRYLAPGQFIWELYRKTAPDLPNRSSFDAEVLQWRIFQHLGNERFTKKHPALHGYVQKGDDARRFELASRLAQLYNQYMVYRMEWLGSWEANRQESLGPDEQWQSALWRILTQDDHTPHRGTLYARFLNGLDTGTIDLPERISLFGISSLSPAYVTILQALGRHTEVNVYLLNPCQEPWHLHPVPHSLLASLGKQGRDFIYFMSTTEGTPPAAVTLFEEPGTDTLLHALQHGILHRTETRTTPQEEDASIRFHSCHTPMREVEVLRDQLMDLFEHDPTLTPSDVMVLAPDIDPYAPYIEAVFPRFAGREIPSTLTSPIIPFEIADRSPAMVDLVVEAWFALLDLSRSRFEADTVIDLLRLEPLRRAFRIESDEIDLLTRWVAEAGIRWGRDPAHKGALGLPETEEFSWAWGLDRMALGVALPRSASGDGPPLYAGMIPYDPIEGDAVDLLDRFALFVQSLREWVEELNTPRPMEEWAGRLNLWLERFFPLQHEHAESRERIRGSVRQSAAWSRSAGITQELTAPILANIMRGELEDDRSGGRFLSGGITFCSMKPMRSLPFRVICLMGMSDGAFPRDRRPPSFDLMRRNYQRGDRIGRLDDRYLFLELLLSARDRLIISYVGEDVRTGKSLPMSTSVSELVDFLGKIAFGGETASAEKRLLIRHPLQSFSPRYFSGEEPRLFSYSVESCGIGREMGRGRKSHHSLFPRDLPLPPAEEGTKIRLADLSRFYTNPTRYLFETRLNVYLREQDTTIENREPLLVAKQEEKSVQKGVYESLLKGGSPEKDLYRVLLAEGKLPVGLPGTEGFVKALRDAEPFAEELKKLLTQGRLPPVSRELRIGGHTLEIETGEMTSGGIYAVRSSKLRAPDRIAFWVAFVGGCLLHPRRGTGIAGTLLGLDRRWTFPEPEEPEMILTRLANWYQTGLTRPLHFYPQSAMRYAEALAKKNREAALHAARAQWESDSEHAEFNDSNDEYYSRVFFSPEEALDAEFIQLAELIAVPAFAGATEVKFNNAP